MSNSSEKGTGGGTWKKPRGGICGGACAPSAKNFCISYIKMVSFCAFPVIFIETVTFTLIKRAGVRTPCRTPLDPPLILRNIIISDMYVQDREMMKAARGNGHVAV